MFKTRLISGIVLVIIALATIISGSWILFFTLLAVSLIGMRELYKVMKVSDEHVTVLELVGYLGAVLYYIAMKADFGNYGTMAIIISMILILFVYVFGYPKYHAEQVMAAITEAQRTNICVYSVDGSPATKTALVNGTGGMTGIGAQSPINMGKTAVKVATALLAGKDYEKDNCEETFFINRDNVEMYGTDGWQ